MSDDPDLRSRLERIASVAGDPPEHGLERVAARRHRRLCRRRGAVATAAVLAVLAAGSLLIARGQARPRSAVTASDTGSRATRPVELPRVVEVHCRPEGIVVPVASVRAQRDGLHVRVHNTLPGPTTLTVEGGGRSSGDIAVAVGVREVRQPVPPGDVTIGCAIGPEVQRREINLVDTAGYWKDPELDCGDAGSVRLDDLPVDPPVASLVAAARAGLDDHLRDGTSGDAIGPVRGYPAQRLGDATDDPVVQVERDGDAIAFAHPRGEGGATTAPWTSLDRVEVCVDVLDAATAEAVTSTTTPAHPARPGSDPPP